MKTSGRRSSPWRFSLNGLNSIASAYLAASRKTNYSRQVEGVRLPSEGSAVSERASNLFSSLLPPVSLLSKISCSATARATSRRQLTAVSLTLTGLLAVSLTFLGGSVDAAFAGTIKGRVNTSAETLPKAPPRYYLGPYRSARAPSVLAEGDPTDVVVYLENAPDSGSAPPPTGNPVMEQKEETFAPHVLPIVAGTTVTFPNKDNFYHNVFSVVAGKRFDLGRYPQGQTSLQTFTKPTVSIVRCEIHSGMKAYIVVLKNSYYAVPNPDGQFELPAVPPGTYTVIAWHPNKREQVKTVTVPESGAVSIDFSF